MTNNENQDILEELDSIGQKNNSEEGNLDIETLSNILNESSLKEEKQSNDLGVIFDINIKSVDDLIDILLKNKYDFLAIEPNNDFVKISFKKDSILKETKNIKYHVYSNILLQAKKISNLIIENNGIEQKGSGEYALGGNNLEVLVKTVPQELGENLFLKVKLSETKVEKKVEKKAVSASKVIGFLGAILFVAIVMGGIFLTFVVFNAQTPQDVSFFSNLGINLNDVNSFLFKLTTIIFSIALIIESIVLIIALFKAILTKKEFKRKKTIFTILSLILTIILFATGTLWITLDKAIKSLPNWQEMSYGNIQMYDNSLLTSSKFSKESALITDYTNLIGPIDIKFDVKYLAKDELRKGFKINKYIWSFGNGNKVESQNPEIIETFSQKGNFEIRLTLEGIDNRFPNKITTKEASGIPTISVNYIVRISEEKLSNGGKTISFDARDLKPLGQLEWYTEDDISKAIFVGEFFQPSKVYFSEESIGLKVKNNLKNGNYMDRVFIVSGESSKIKGEIDYQVSIDNDLNYIFKVKNLENSFGDGFIKSFKWIIDNREITKMADILKIEESSNVSIGLTGYGKKEVKVIITNSSGKSVEIKKEINIQKSLKLKNSIDIYENSQKVEGVKFDNKTREYFIYDLGSPTALIFDAKNIRSDNPLYYLEEVKWDLGGDGNIEETGKYFTHEFNSEGFEEISVNYKFIHRRDKKEIINIVEKINLEFVQKEAILDLNMKSESEYAPTIVSFDASLSKVKDDNIVKFIYDYGDGTSEERDAINPGHKYLKEGNYTVKLTIVTTKGKQYSTSKSLILKSFESKVAIKTSMNKAPINQEIDFLSTDSQGQIIGYFWDFGDGITSTEANPSHAYKTAGKYKVKLTLDFANNNVLSEDTEIEIE